MYMLKIILSFLVIIVFFLLLAKARSRNSKRKIVYITSACKKYHREDCHFILGEHEPIEIQTAIDKGYLPCKVCNPNN